MASDHQCKGAELPMDSLPLDKETDHLHKVEDMVEQHHHGQDSGTKEEDLVVYHPADMEEASEVHHQDQIWVQTYFRATRYPNLLSNLT